MMGKILKYDVDSKSCKEWRMKSKQLSLFNSYILHVHMCQHQHSLTIPHKCFYFTSVLFPTQNDQSLSFFFLVVSNARNFLFSYIPQLWNDEIHQLLMDFLYCRGENKEKGLQSLCFMLLGPKIHIGHGWICMTVHTSL